MTDAIRNLRAYLNTHNRMFAEVYPVKHIMGLREAAEQAGTAKSTILRAIQSGRLSAERNAQGGYDIDADELFRVYPPSLDPATDHADCFDIGAYTFGLIMAANSVLAHSDDELVSELPDLRTVAEQLLARVEKLGG